MKRKVMENRPWLSILAGLVLSSSVLLANPVDPIVIAGQAQFAQPNPATLNVKTSTHKTIIDWKGFSIGPNETTHFDQPSSASTVLNRVQHGNPSKLQGLLKSNGRVMLINPSGVLATQSAVVNTASFVASTLDLNNDNFLNGGDLLFRGDSTASVVNYGTIESWDGDVLLIGHQVANHGSLKAPKGTVGMAAAQEVLLKPSSSELLFIRPSARTPSADIGIDQAGTIQAVQAELKADGNPYALAIKQSGRVSADGVEKKNGRVYLVSKSGKVKNTGTVTAKTKDVDGKSTGGRVEILAKKIIVDDAATIDVSGDAGGEVLIGGDFQGKNPAIYNAEHTYVGKDVTINADATGNGHAGRVIVWADDATGFYGNVTARGAQQPLPRNATRQYGTPMYTSDGGFVEISGKNYLEYHGLVNTLAPHGSPGLLLLDPTTMTVTAGATTASFSGGDYTGSGATANINFAELIANLSLTPVRILTASAGAGNGDIIISSALLYNSPNNFTLIADRDIVMDASVINSGTGGLFATAGRNYTHNATSQVQYVGPIDLNITGDVFLNIFSTLVSSTSITADAANFTVDSTATVSSGGPLSINAAQNILIASAGSIDAGGAGDLTLAAGNNITVSGLLRQLGTGDLIASADNNFTVNGTVLTGSGDITLSADNTFTLNPAGAITTTSGDITINGGTVNILEDLETAPGPGFILINAVQAFNLAATKDITTAAGDLTINGGLVYTQGANSTVGSTTTGDVTVTATDATVGASASIYTNDGPLNVLIANNLTTDAGSTIQTEGAGNALVQVGNDLLANGVIRALSTGSMTIDVGHNFNANSVVSANNSDLTIDVGNDFTVGAGANVFTNGGDLTIDVGNDLVVSFIANISTGSGDLTIDVARDMSIANFTTVTTQTGDLTANIGRDFRIAEGGTMSVAGGELVLNVGRDFFSEPFDTIQSTGAGDVTIDIGHDALASGIIRATTSGDVDINVGNDLILFGDILTNAGALDVNVGRDISFTSNSGLGLSQSFGTIAGPMTVTAGRDFTAQATALHEAFIGVPAGGPQTNTNPLTIITGRTFTLGPNSRLRWGTGPTAIVVDNDFPQRPLFGPGAFNLDPDAIFSTFGRVQIYTSLRNLNHIGAPINGVPFVPGPLFVNTPTEMWNIYFPERLGLDGIPFTFYYKNGIPHLTEMGWLVTLMPNYLYYFLNYQNCYTYYDAPMPAEDSSNAQTTN